MLSDPRRAHSLNFENDSKTKSRKPSDNVVAEIMSHALVGVCRLPVGIPGFFVLEDAGQRDLLAGDGAVENGAKIDSLAADVDRPDFHPAFANANDAAAMDAFAIPVRQRFLI